MIMFGSFPLALVAKQPKSTRVEQPTLLCIKFGIAVYVTERKHCAELNRFATGSNRILSE